ncbi:MAG TPA: MlaD family protein [Woeseiaceae bacterium]|nr:MlaD family protein [Woeseiaceae bacterium]
MVSKSSYTLVGAFVLVLGAAFIWGILWISAGGAPRDYNHYVVYMTESVSGLNPDSLLKFRGVDVGKVERIDIDGDNPHRIRLLLQVRDGTPITTDTVATLEYQGLTGLANINLSGGDANSKSLQKGPGQDYPVIPTSPSLFARLDANMSDLLASLIHLSTNVNELLGQENRKNIGRSIENVAVLTETLAEQSAGLETIVTRLGETLDNANAATASFPQLMDDFSQGAGAVTRMAEEIRTLAESVAAANTGIQQAIEAGSEGLTDITGSTLPELDALVSELRQASENFRRMSESLADDPSVLFYGRAEPEPGPGE